jgi:dolichyl-phosphate-mannose-protein mannosyltransferase
MAHKGANKGKSSEQSVKGKAGAQSKPESYASHGVTDNDVFLLPGRDFQIMAALTVVALAVRLFRIYQPTSVVFDEVQ